ncbi:MAG TPA: YhgE/Pip domain-containing protein [Microlunatus sp.]
MTNPFRIAAGEFRRFRGPLPKLALVFVTLVPLLYGAIYLAANWDPYGKLSELPVAIVNQDKPAKAEGKTITAGDDFVDELKSQGEFDWHETDEASARQGLQDGDYYLVVTVPEDFSTDLVSGQTDDPQRAGIEIRRNDANGFVIGTITGSAQTKIEQAVDQSAVRSYFDVVFQNLATIKSGLDDAADGAGQLDDGLKQAHTGSGKLADGSTTLATGAQQLETGSATLSSGLETASTGADDLSDGLTTMQGKSAELADGADQVATGTQQLTDTVVPPLTQLQKSLPQLKKDATNAGNAMNDIADAAAGGSESISDDLGQADSDLARLETKYPELADDPAFTRLSDRVGSASDRADNVADAAREQATVVSGITDGVQDNISQLSGSIASTKQDVNQLNKGAHQVAKGNHQLNTAIASAATGASSLSDGVGKAADGADDLHTGAKKLSNGADSLKTGAHDLDTALGQLSDGATTLHDQLSVAAKKVPAVSGDQQDQAAQVLSSPAQVTMHVDNPATYYGRGLAPMFFSIALWVFGITAFLILRPLTGRTLLGRSGALARQLGSWLPAGMLAVLGGFLTIGTIWLFLGLDPVRPLALIAVTALGAIAFSAVAQFLRMTLGTVGSAIMLVWLILQLASTGGTYPAAVLPPFFATINPYMPMTYLIDAFRVTISGGETAHLLRDLIVIGSTAVVALGLGTLTMIKRQRLAVRDLHPPLEPA